MVQGNIEEAGMKLDLESAGILQTGNAKADKTARLYEVNDNRKAKSIQKYVQKPKPSTKRTKRKASTQTIPSTIVALKLHSTFGRSPELEGPASPSKSTHSSGFELFQPQL